MLSDTELRSELQQLGFNPGPITAATRSTYLKKLQKLQDANAVPYTNGKYLQVRWLNFLFAKLDDFCGIRFLVN